MGSDVLNWLCLAISIFWVQWPETDTDTGTDADDVAYANSDAKAVDADADADAVLVWAGRTTAWTPGKVLDGKKLSWGDSSVSFGYIPNSPDAVYEHTLRRVIDGSLITLITRVEQPPQIGPACRPRRVLSATLGQNGVVRVDVSGFIYKRAESFVSCSRPAYGSLSVSDLVRVLITREARKDANARWTLRVVMHDKSVRCFHDRDRIAW